MATITKMSHLKVTAEFTMEEWLRLKMAIEAGSDWYKQHGICNARIELLLKSISPSPAPSLHPSGKTRAHK